MPDHTKERLLDGEVQVIEIDTIRLHRPVHQRPRAVVVPARERKLEFGHDCLPLAARAYRRQRFLTIFEDLLTAPQSEHWILCVLVGGGVGRTDWAFGRGTVADGVATGGTGDCGHRASGLLDEQRDTRDATGPRQHSKYAAEGELLPGEFGDEERSRDPTQATDAKHPCDTGAAPPGWVKAGRQCRHRRLRSVHQHTRGEYDQ